MKDSQDGAQEKITLIHNKIVGCMVETESTFKGLRTTTLRFQIIVWSFFNLQLYKLYMNMMLYES